MQRAGADTNMNDASFNNELPDQPNNQNLFPTIQPSTSGLKTLNGIEEEDTYRNKFNTSNQNQQNFEASFIQSQQKVPTPSYPALNQSSLPELNPKQNAAKDASFEQNMDDIV